MYNFLLSKGNALLKNSILYKYVIIENQMKRKPSFWNTAKFLISILFEIERTNVFFLEKKKEKNYLHAKSPLVVDCTRQSQGHSVY